MKTQIPYNSGDYVQLINGFGNAGGPRYVVMGHVWWPIEKVNAYHMLPVNEYGEPTDDETQYLWDNRIDEPSKFKLFEPKAQAA